MSSAGKPLHECSVVRVTYDFNLDWCGSTRFATSTYMIGKRCCDTCWLPETVAWFSLVGLIRSAEIYTRWNKGSLISIARSRKYTFSNISATHDCMLVLSDHGSSLSPIANALEYGDLKISLPTWCPQWHRYAQAARPKGSNETIRSTLWVKCKRRVVVVVLTDS